MLKTYHLYQILLNPQTFAEYLYHLDPYYDCGEAGDEYDCPFQLYVEWWFQKHLDLEVSCVAGDFGVSVQQCHAPYARVTGVTPPWVKRLRYSLAAEHCIDFHEENGVFPYECLVHLGAALDIDFPESPFNITRYPWYQASEDLSDSPFDSNPFDSSTELNGLELYCTESEIRPSRKGDVRYCALHFTNNKVFYTIDCVIPPRFDFHIGVQPKLSRKVVQVQSGVATNGNSIYLIEFECGGKLAFPYQGEIEDETDLMLRNSGVVAHA